MLSIHPLNNLMSILWFAQQTVACGVVSEAATISTLPDRVQALPPFSDRQRRSTDFPRLQGPVLPLRSWRTQHSHKH